MLWDLVVKAAEAHTDELWVLLDAKLWLAACAVQQADGTLIERDRCTLKGSAVSPAPAHLFLQLLLRRADGAGPTDYSVRTYYVDDVVWYIGVSECQAREAPAAIG